MKVTTIEDELNSLAIAAEELSSVKVPTVKRRLQRILLWAEA